MPISEFEADSTYRHLETGEYSLSSGGKNPPHGGYRWSQSSGAILSYVRLNYPDKIFPPKAIHLSSAIHRCAIHGAWSTPYEVTVGDDTTKISSCLACTTYMYALGYPPSSAHLGRGESWVPPISGDKFAIEKTSYPENVAPAEVITAPNFYQESICDRYEKNWSRDIHSYMNLGVYIILEGEKRQKAILDETLEDGPTKVEIEPIPVIADTHKGSLNTLSDFLNTKPKRSVSSISTRFLDALTVHDSDWKRVRRTFLPLYDRKRVKELILSGLVRKKS